jgi:hypothetical protein
VRNVSPNSGKIISTLLELVEMDARDLSARAMYQTFKGVLEKFGQLEWLLWSICNGGRT